MLNKEKIRIMTAAAVYEKRHQEEIALAKGWFRADYIGVRLLKNAVRLTLAYLIGCAFFVVLHFEEIMEKLGVMDVSGLAQGIVFWYGVCLAAYLAATYLAASVRFYRAERRMRTYGRYLDRLEKENRRRVRHRHREERQELTNV